MSNVTSITNTPFYKACSGVGTAPQLIIDTFNNGVDAPYTYLCSGSASNPQSGSTIDDFGCGQSILCIGGINQQHACVCEGKGQLISWQSAKATRCAQSILDFMNVQPLDIGGTCCNSDHTQCVTDNNFKCTSPKVLTVCVTDGIGAECVTPSTKAICSGNYTTPLNTSSTAPASEATNAFGVTNNNGGGGLGTNGIIGVAIGISVFLCICGGGASRARRWRAAPEIQLRPVPGYIRETTMTDRTWVQQ